MPKATPEVTNETGEVMSYGALVDAIAASTGQKKSVVREILDHTQRTAAQFLRQQTGNRVHLGRFCTFFSVHTKKRVVNDPRNAGAKLISEPHVAVRMTPGTHTKAYMKSERETWESRD